MQELRERTGLEYDPVMVFPQGGFCKAALRALDAEGFLAALSFLMGAICAYYRYEVFAPRPETNIIIMFLVGGSEKAEMVRRALTDPGANLPCQKICPDDGELIWFLDQAAAARL